MTDQPIFKEEVQQIIESLSQTLALTERLEWELVKEWGKSIITVSVVEDDFPSNGN